MCPNFGYLQFFRNSGLLFIENLQVPTVTSGWGDADNSNQEWGVILVGPYINVEFAWGSTIPACLAHTPRSLENLQDAARYVRDDFCCLRCRELMRRRYTSRNHIVNPRTHFRGDD